MVEIEVLSFMPDRPEVHVAVSVVMPVVAVVSGACTGARRPEDSGRVLLLNYSLYSTFIQLLIVFEVPFSVFSCLLIPAQCSEVLVVAAPECDRRSCLEASYLVGELLFDR